VDFSTHLLCADRRDAIYGVLSLVDRSIAIEPDYSKELKDILWDILSKGVPHAHVDCFENVEQIFRFGYKVREALGLEDSITDNEIDGYVASKLGEQWSPCE
jgi:hypothetical protein